MDGLLDIISSTFRSIHISKKDIKNVNGFVNEMMKLLEWIIIEIDETRCLIIRINDEEEIEEECLLNKDEVIEMNGKNEMKAEKGTLDEENGSRFEGSVFDGIPFGFGLLFNENGNRVYEGIVINWKRMGYGMSFNENGFKEYEGYWCNDLRCGSGKSFDLEGNIVYEGNWCSGKEITYDYEGDGSNLNINVKRLKLVNNCILACFDVSLFTFLEELIIGDGCFDNVDTFRIERLSQLKLLKIGNNSFTNNNHEGDSLRSFHVCYCVKLESIEIGYSSFNNYGGEFELTCLPSLLRIKIGVLNKSSFNFRDSSFVVTNLPKVEYIELGNGTFMNSLSSVISYLPNLRSLQLGSSAIFGRDESSSSLEMTDLPKLEEISCQYANFYHTRKIHLSNIPNVTTFNVCHSFQEFTTAEIDNVAPCIKQSLASRQS